MLSTSTMSPSDKATKRYCLCCSKIKTGVFEQYHAGTNCIGKTPFLLTVKYQSEARKGKDGLVCSSCAVKNRKLQVRPRPFSSSLCKNSSLSLHQRAKLPTPLLVESPGIETPAIKEKSLEEYLLEPPEPPVTPSRPGPRIRDPPAPKKRKQREEAYLEDLGDTQRLKRLKRLREALPEALENILKEHLNPRNVVLHELRFSISGEEYHVVFHSPNDEPETEFDLEELPINKRQKVLMASQKHFFLFCFLFLTSWFTPKLIDNPCHGPQCYFQAGL